MRDAVRRSILRWVHLVLAVPIAGYVYSPFAHLPDYAGPTRYVFFPAMVLTGLWLWKGAAVRRRFTGRPARPAAVANRTGTD